MYFILDVLIKKDEISKMDLSELLVEWGGESFSQSPAKYKNKSELVFEEFLDLNYYKDYYYRFLDKDFDKENYVAFRLLGSHMFDLERQVNNTVDDLSNNNVMLFLRELFNLNYFTIFLIRDEECIDNKYLVTDTSEFIKIFCNALNRTSPEGIVVTKKAGK